MSRGDILATLVVSDGARDTEDAVIGTGREIELGHGLLDESKGLIVELAMLSHQGGSHLGIAVNEWMLLETHSLNLTSLEYPLADDGRRLRGLCLRYLIEAEGQDLDLQVYTIEQWARDLAEVSANLSF